MSKDVKLTLLGPGNNISLSRPNDRVAGECLITHAENKLSNGQML